MREELDSFANLAESEMSAETVLIKTLPESSYSQWDDFVCRCENGSIYSTAAYLEIFTRAADGRFEILAACRGEDFLGGIGLYVRKSIAGSYIQNRLLLYYNGIVTADLSENERSDVIERLLGALRRRGYARVLLHNRSAGRSVAAPSDWQRSETKTYVVSLDSPESIWKAFDKNTRRLVRRAEEAGITVSADTDFESFYEMHTDIHLRKGAWLYLPKERFRRYLKELQEKNLGQLYHARTPSGEAVASQLVLLGKHPVTHTVAAGAHRRWMSIGVNPLIRWKVFELLSYAGYKANDLTDAANVSVARFKAQLGGVLESNYVLRRPDTTAYRLYCGASEGSEWCRSKARAILKRMSVRTSGQEDNG